MESPQDLIAKLEYISMINTLEAFPEIEPNFESLPPELILNIIEYVPEAICQLRLTSQALKALVDEFVHQRPAIPIVRQIIINDHYYRYDDVEQTVKENDPGTMRIWLEVPVRTAQLFELRVKWCGVNRTSMERTENEDCGPRGYVNKYCFNCEIPFANGTNNREWECLAEAIGSKIGKVDVSIRGKTELAPMCTLIAQFQIEQLELQMEKLSETEAMLLLDTIQHHNLEWLSLRMTTSTTSTLVDFLLELSTHLRSLHIRGEYPADVKWTPLIIEMLSRKLDMLEINHWRREILSREDADILIVSLPFIGKKVWFKADFVLNRVGRNNKINGHIIYETCPIPRPNKPRKDRALSIIHKSRLNEVSPRAF